MAITDHKIPIIVGRNDIPTTSDIELNHPNGSYVTDKYNALADEITAIDINQTLETSNADGLTLYVNTSTGNDTNDGLTLGTAVLTIQQAIDILAVSYLTNTAIIEIDGNVTDIILDFSKLQANTEYGSTQYGNYITLTSATTWTYTLTDYLRWYKNNPIYNTNIRIENCIFEQSQPVSISNESCFIEFRTCTFNFNAGNYDANVMVSNSASRFDGCTFNAIVKAVNAYVGVCADDNAYVEVENCIFNDHEDAFYVFPNSTIINEVSALTFNNADEIGFINHGHLQLSFSTALTLTTADFSITNNGTVGLDTKQISTQTAPVTAMTGSEDLAGTITKVNELITLLKDNGIAE